MAKFRVGDEVQILSNDDSQFDVGKIGIIKSNDGSGYREWEVDFNGTSEWFDGEEIELAAPKLTENQRITALEETVTKQGEEIAELKVIVAQIRKPSTEVAEALAINFEANADVLEFEGKQYKKVDREARNGDVVVFKKNETDEGYSTTYKPYRVVGMDSLGSIFKGDNGTQFNVYAEAHNRTPETVDVYELIVEDKQPPFMLAAHIEPKSNNQLRAEVIEKAKGFVVEYSKGEQRVPWECGTGQWYLQDFEFVVNEAKRTIIVLCKSCYGGVYKRGIAKCMPGDVFNEHIGRAIALGRALGLDVSEFECAVQPTLAIGQIVFETEDKTHRTISAPGFYEEESMLTAIDSRSAKELSVIINDTNAQYGGVE